MEITRLSDFPHLAEPLARWHHTYWHGLLPWWHFDDALAELQDHAAGDSLPTTLIAMESGQLLGSVSLVYEDLPEDELPADVVVITPWMASLFVLPPCRGKGIGTALVDAATQYARVAGETRLSLITMDREEFYQDLGWSVSTYFRYRGQPAALMQKPLPTPVKQSYSWETGSSKSWCQSSVGSG